MRTSTITLYTIFFLVLSSLGCKQSTQPEVKEGLLAIDLQTHFSHDTVRVKINNEVAYYDTATSSLVIGFAKRIQRNVSRGQYLIDVNVLNHSAQAETLVTVQDTLLVGVVFNRTSKEIKFFLYDFLIIYE